MKILHIIPVEKFTGSVLSLYEENIFTSDEHHFLIYLKKGDMFERNLYKSETVFLYHTKRDCFKLLEHMSGDFDYIFLHSFFIPGFLMALLLFKKSIARKIVWIGWGFDLYEDGPKGFKHALYNRLKKLVVNIFNAYIGIFPPDCEYFKKRFPKSKARIFYAPYIGISSLVKTEYDPTYSLLKKKSNNNETIYIQIGHQANPQLQHEYVLLKLAKFSNENIHLIIPLSYGDKENAKKVKQLAENLFGNKCTVLSDFIPRDQYLKLLSNVDIAIFYTSRQIGLGNITSLLKKNTKIYMKKDGVMYPFYKGLCAPVYDFDDIDNMTFKDFIAYDEPSPAFINYVKVYYTPEKRVELWNNVYESLREALKKTNKNVNLQ